MSCYCKEYRTFNRRFPGLMKKTVSLPKKKAKGVVQPSQKRCSVSDDLSKAVKAFDKGQTALRTEEIFPSRKKRR